MIFIRHYGVLGAAIGTALAELVVCVLMLWTVCFRSPVFRFRREKLGGIDKRILFNALHIGAPLAFEHVAVCGAMIATTRIIAPLGTVAIAANSFAVTAESFCYMPGYGIAEAATALVGQSLGAGKEKIAKSFSNLSVLLGGGIMAVTGAVMFFICPWVFPADDSGPSGAAAGGGGPQDPAVCRASLRCVHRGFRSSPGSGGYSGPKYFKSDQYLGRASDPGPFTGRQMGTPWSVDCHVH